MTRPRFVSLETNSSIAARNEMTKIDPPVGFYNIHTAGVQKRPNSFQRLLTHAENKIIQEEQA
jgi:hypothetical protein